MTESLASQIANIINKDEILSILSPYIDADLPANDPQAKKWLRQRRNGIIHLIFNNIKKRYAQNIRGRTHAEVKVHYETNYAKLNAGGGYYTPRGKPVTYTYNNHVLKMQGDGLHLAMAEIILRVLRVINPDSVCDVGCGFGQSSAFLGAYYPYAAFNAFDLSHNAIKKANEAKTYGAKALGLPDTYGQLNAQQLQRINAINYFQSSASDLSAIDDNAFDVIYSTASLEQMCTILPEVLSELHRVTKRYAIFCEPFWEANTPLERVFLWSQNYFRQDMAYMEHHGFKLVTMIDLPVKPTFAYSVMIAEII